MWPQALIAQIEGGLGNQLFQYAACRTLADRLGCDLLLDLRALNANADRPFLLSGYAIRASVASAEVLNDLPPSHPARWARVKSRFSQAFPGIGSFPAFWPRSFAYDKRVEDISRPVWMAGYWQSEKYFLANRQRILNDLRLQAFRAEDIPYYSQIRSCNSVALHIRRGDYVSNPNVAKFHGLCSVAYYQAAIADLLKHQANIAVFVFSDDQAWAKASLNLPVPTHFVEDYAQDPTYSDLELMASCNHHIIANSSFSWWGAWRCSNAEQRVYAPLQWFNDPNVDVRDVCPAHWVRLSR
jgi:hypothetical protein